MYTHRCIGINVHMYTHTHTYLNQNPPKINVNKEGRFQHNNSRKLQPSHFQKKRDQTEYQQTGDAFHCSLSRTHRDLPPEHFFPTQNTRPSQLHIFLHQR